LAEAREAQPSKGTCVRCGKRVSTDPAIAQAGGLLLLPSWAARGGQRGGCARSLDGRQASSCLALPARRPTGRNRAPAVVDKKRILSYLGNCLPALVTAKLPSRTRSPPPRHAVTAPPHATARHRILPIGKAKTLAFLPPTAILIFLHALCSAQKPMTTRTRTCRGRASELAPDHRT
jgi:hypothetical protein